jgi:hypothetical protein
MKVLINVAIAAVLASPVFGAHTDSVTGEDIHTVNVVRNAVTFIYDGEEGRPAKSVTISGEEGLACLSMYQHIDSVKRTAKDKFGLAFSIDLRKGTCHMQTRPMGM